MVKHTTKYVVDYTENYKFTVYTSLFKNITLILIKNNQNIF